VLSIQAGLRRWLPEQGRRGIAGNQFQERFKVANLEDCATLDANLQKGAVDEFPRPPIRQRVAVLFLCGMVDQS
jgi:hypothetical protein